MSDHLPSLSILIVNWRSKDYLRRCLHSIAATCADLTPEIVVVDGGSFDGCGEMLTTEFPGVIFVQNPENTGFARSNNLGFERVSGEAVLLLNPDTEIMPGAIQLLLTELLRLPNCGILGSKLLNADRTLQTSCVHALPTPLNQALGSEFLKKLFPKSDLWGVAAAFGSTAPVAVQGVSGACMLLWSDVFRRVGGFSPQFFMYGEDMDLCAKVQRLALKVYHVPGAEVVHFGSGSSKTQYSQFTTLQQRVAGEVYMRLNHGRFVAFLYRAFQGFSAIARLGLILGGWIVLSEGRRNSARESLAKWKGILGWSLGLSGSKKGLSPKK
jgi:N-acetylglucosaminyl-diphospho-decaprenol L-rhamnosyltransferase